MSVHAVFDAEVRRWKGDGAWHLVTLPVELADAIEDAHHHAHRAGAASPPTVAVRLRPTSPPSA